MPQPLGWLASASCLTVLKASFWTEIIIWTSIPIPNSVKTTVMFFLVRRTPLKSLTPNVTGMLLTSNVLKRSGARTTDIAQHLVPFRNIHLSNVLTANPFTSPAKPTTPRPVKNSVILTLVRQDRSSKKIPDVVLMILLMVLAVPRQDVRAIPRQIHLLMARMAQTAVSIVVITPVT